MKGSIDVFQLKGKTLTAKAGNITENVYNNYIYNLEVTDIQYNTPTGYDTITFKANEDINIPYIEIYDRTTTPNTYMIHSGQYQPLHLS